MKPQVLKDSNGKDTGVFIPMSDWIRLKEIYPNIEDAGKELDKWEKDLIDNRLDEIAKNPERLTSGETFLKSLKRKDL